MINKKIEQSEFLTYEDKDYEIMFSTATNGVSYNINDVETKEKLNYLGTSLKLDYICYLKQVHSDKIIILNANEKIQGEIEGDSIITNARNVAIGIFTADCVPVIIIDGSKKVIAAVHSGWKGTIKNIVGQTIMEMQRNFNCSCEDLKIFIGPHNKDCCYEVSEELIREFNNVDLFRGRTINNQRCLSLEQCIIAQCTNLNIDEGHIIKSRYCTFCSTNPLFHSYRKDKEKAGRQISLIYLK